MCLIISRKKAEKVTPLICDKIQRLLGEKVTCEMIDVPFENDFEVGIEINTKSIFLSLSIVGDVLYSLEVMVEDNIQRQGIATNIKCILIDVSRENGISEYWSCGIHNPVILKICDKLGIIEGDNINRMIRFNK